VRGETHEIVKGHGERERDREISYHKKTSRNETLQS
jgi:hypothetical protein